MKKRKVIAMKMKKKRKCRMLKMTKKSKEKNRLNRMIMERIMKTRVWASPNIQMVNKITLKCIEELSEL